MFHLKGFDKVHHRIHQGAVLGIQDLKTHFGHLAGPLLLESLDIADAQIHMHRHQVAGDGAGKADGFKTAAMQLAHQHHRWGSAAHWRIGQFEQLVRGQAQATADGVIVVANAQENSH